MRILAKDICPYADCPTVADPEDNSGDFLIVGKRVTGHYPGLVGTGEEVVKISRDLLEKALRSDVTAG